MPAEQQGLSALIFPSTQCSPPPCLCIRRRPDRSALYAGETGAAGAEKIRLEEMQVGAAGTFFHSTCVCLSAGLRGRSLGLF